MGHDGRRNFRVRAEVKTVKTFKCSDPRGSSLLGSSLQQTRAVRESKLGG